MTNNGEVGARIRQINKKLNKVEQDIGNRIMATRWCLSANTKTNACSKFSQPQKSPLIRERETMVWGRS